MRKASIELRQRLANNIQRYRKKAQLSQEELAEKCGLHRTYIGSIERCERNVTLSTLELLSVSLNISITDLLT
jgi:transcriptional regulator with XRE-family HTH domain